MWTKHLLCAYAFRLGGNNAKQERQDPTPRAESLGRNKTLETDDTPVL